MSDPFPLNEYVENTDEKLSYEGIEQSGQL